MVFLLASWEIFCFAHTDAYPYNQLQKRTKRTSVGKFLVVEPAHLGLNPRFGTRARIFLDLTGVILSMVGDVPVDGGAHMVTSSISRSSVNSVSGGVHHKGRVAYMHS